MMMLDPFRKLFGDVDERLEDHLEISLCDPSYRTFFADGSRLDGSPNVARMVRQIELLSGTKDALAYPRLLGDLAALYEASIPTFVRNPYSKIGDFASVTGLVKVAKHRMLGNLAKRIESYMDDERLRMLFSFQTMYLGLSPFDAPWVYATLAYMEYGEGIWYPKGGMVRIAESIANLARSKGADIRLLSPVKSIRNRSVELESGEVVEADAVICNADLPYANEHLTSLEASKKRHSCSAFMAYIDYSAELPELEHHNVFFGKDFRGNLDAIFHEHRIPDDPAFYACISSKTDLEQTEAGSSNLYILVPCPNLDHAFSEQDAKQLLGSAFKRLACESSFDPIHVRALKTYSPHDWQADLNLSKGAAFGLSHDLFQSAFFRPGNRSKTNKSLYYVGASTIPGNGLPMVLISAELAEARLIEDGLI
jgi:phytoene desaturase